MTRFGFIFTAVSAMFSMVAASCQLENHKDSYHIQNTYPYCSPQGEGDYTFTMIISATDIPSFSGDDPNAGYVSGHVFIIYDNYCNILGVYTQPAGDIDCGKPYIIEDYFLDYVITIDAVGFGVGDPYYRFYYANVEYSIGNNHCVCHSNSHGLAAEKVCPCAFPVHGE